MIYVSEVLKTPPETCKTALQAAVYQALATLEMPYERVETDEIITMEDCAAVEARLSMRMVKTLFLCNRQQSEFYLFVTRGDKPFRAKDFSAALHTARPSFAPAERMGQLLGTTIGAATIFSMLLPSASAVRPVLDRDVLRDPYYGCSDGTTTGYLKLRTDDICARLLPYAGKTPAIIEV